MWQNIETAPKDEIILVYIHGAAAGQEYEIASCASDDPDGDWYSAAHEGPPFDMPPTHWQMLPDAPTEH